MSHNPLKYINLVNLELNHVADLIFFLHASVFSCFLYIPFLYTCFIFVVVIFCFIRNIVER